ncbi:hypothetical protein D3C72_1756790 [compost metagenome]
MPNPPSASGTDKAVRPWEAILLRRSGERPASVSQISRSISGAASVIRKRLMASRKVSWSSLKVKSMACSYFGKPSIRSAMMLRWISLVPA